MATLPRRFPRLAALLAGAALALAAGSAAACEFYANGFTLIHPWADPTPAGVTDAPVYFRLEGITRDDRLVRAASFYAQRVEMRADDDANAPAAGELVFASGDAAEFTPGHGHLVMRGLKTPLELGRSYLMTLEFEKAGRVLVAVSVGAH
jgi:copper(I)-binding protein